MSRFLYATPRLVLIALLLSVSGCAARYHEPARADKEAAHLEAIVPIWIVSIDHAKVSRIGISGREEFRISPGPHTIGVEYSIIESQVQTSSTSPALLNFTAAPGRNYYIKAGRIDDHWRPYITDSL